MKRNSSRDGFTLIELLVVVLISALLSSLAIVYSHVGQDQVSLSVEAAKISELILQAKELSISTYNSNSATCAYGVHFDYTNQTYSLFAYSSATGTPAFCPTYASTTADGVVTSSMTQYIGGGTWQIHISPGVVMESSSVNNDVLTDVLFFPPDPLTLMSRDDITFSTSTSKIYLQTANGSAKDEVSVSPAGQVGY